MKHVCFWRIYYIFKGASRFPSFVHARPLPPAARSLTKSHYWSFEMLPLVLMCLGSLLTRYILALNRLQNENLPWIWRAFFEMGIWLVLWVLFGKVNPAFSVLNESHLRNPAGSFTTCHISDVAFVSSTSRSAGASTCLRGKSLSRTGNFSVMKSIVLFAIPPALLKIWWHFLAGLYESASGKNRDSFSLIERKLRFLVLRLGYSYTLLKCCILSLLCSNFRRQTERSDPEARHLRYQTWLYSRL